MIKVKGKFARLRPQQLAIWMTVWMAALATGVAEGQDTDPDIELFLGTRYDEIHRFNTILESESFLEAELALQNVYVQTPKGQKVLRNLDETSFMDHAYLEHREIVMAWMSWSDRQTFPCYAMDQLRKAHPDYVEHGGHRVIAVRDATQNALFVQNLENGSRYQLTLDPSTKTWSDARWEAALAELWRSLRGAYREHYPETMRTQIFEGTFCKAADWSEESALELIMYGAALEAYELEKDPREVLKDLAGGITVGFALQRLGPRIAKFAKGLLAVGAIGFATELLGQYHMRNYVEVGRMLAWLEYETKLAAISLGVGSKLSQLVSKGASKLGQVSLNGFFTTTPKPGTAMPSIGRVPVKATLTTPTSSLPAGTGNTPLNMPHLDGHFILGSAYRNSVILDMPVPSTEANVPSQPHTLAPLTRAYVDILSPKNLDHLSEGQAASYKRSWRFLLGNLKASIRTEHDFQFQARRQAHMIKNFVDRQQDLIRGTLNAPGLSFQLQSVDYLGERFELPIIESGPYGDDETPEEFDPAQQPIPPISPPAETDDRRLARLRSASVLRIGDRAFLESLIRRGGPLGIEAQSILDAFRRGSGFRFTVISLQDLRRYSPFLQELSEKNSSYLSKLTGRSFYASYRLLQNFRHVSPDHQARMAERYAKIPERNARHLRSVLYNLSDKELERLPYHMVNDDLVHWSPLFFQRQYIRKMYEPYIQNLPRFASSWRMSHAYGSQGTGTNLVDQVSLVFTGHGVPRVVLQPSHVGAEGEYGLVPIHRTHNAYHISFQPRIEPEGQLSIAVRSANPDKPDIQRGFYHFDPDDIRYLDQTVYMGRSPRFQGPQHVDYLIIPVVKIPQNHVDPEWNYHDDVHSAGEKDYMVAARLNTPYTQTTRFELKGFLRRPIFISPNNLQHRVVHQLDADREILDALRDWMYWESNTRPGTPQRQAALMQFNDRYYALARQMGIDHRRFWDHQGETMDALESYVRYAQASLPKGFEQVLYSREYVPSSWLRSIETLANQGQPTPLPVGVRYAKLRPEPGDHTQPFGPEYLSVNLVFHTHSAIPIEGPLPMPQTNHSHLIPHNAKFTVSEIVVDDTDPEMPEYYIVLQETE